MQRYSSTLLLCSVALGCSNDFTEPSHVDTLRALGVHAEPASGVPGQTSELDLIVADGAASEGASDASGSGAAPNARPLQVAWLGACHNPPSRQFYGCFPILQRIATRLAARVIDTDSSSLPRGAFALGPHYELAVPAGILREAPQSSADPIHYGVSYAFFAACAGELRARPDLNDRVPLDCVDPLTGRPLGRRDFVSGYATLYTYQGALNHNPTLSSVHVGSVAVTPTPCTNDADCANLVPSDAGFSEICGSQGQCALSFPACPGQSECPAVRVSPDLEPTSAEPLPGEAAHEIVWANFYASKGRFETSTQLVNDRNSGFIADHGSFFHPPAAPLGPTTIWITVNDQRGGSALQSFEVWTH